MMSAQATGAHPSDADALQKGKSLQQKLQAVDLSDPQSSASSQEPKRTKLSARDFLERLNRKRLEVARINFTAEGTQAGRGSHGEVVVGILTLDDDIPSESAKQIAVKKFIFSDNIDEEKFLRAFANELHVLDRLDHPNIIKLVGFVEDMKTRKAWLVFPWEANGNVREFLLSGKWELPERVSLIQDVASGLEYLHRQQPPIRHGDLKSLNILVNSKHRAVITDFGSARIQTEARGFEAMGGSPGRPAALNESTITLDGACPEVTVSAANAELTLAGPSWSFRWAAPEILNEEEPGLASDIWALGWIAWEVVTDNYPFPEAKTNQMVTVKVVKGLLPSLYDDGQLSQIGQLCDIMVKCWKTDPKERLSASECRSALQWVPSAIPRARNRVQIRSAALLLEMGSMHVSRCMYKEALELFDEAFAIAQSTADRGTMARALYLSVDSHRVLSNYDKAEEACKQSLAIYTSIGSDPGRASVLKTLGEVYQSQSKDAKAEEYFNQALPIFTSSGNKLGQANTLQRLGLTYRAQYNNDKAEESLNQAIAIYTSIGNSIGRANAFQGLGEVHQARSDHAKAEECLQQSLSIATGIGSTIGRANALRRLGQTHQAQSNHAEAEECYSQALTLYTSIGSSLGQANALQGCGEIYQARSNHAKAEENLKQAFSIYTSIGNIVGQANALQALGLTQQAQSNYSEAEKYFTQALAIFTSIGDNFGRATVSHGLGGIYQIRSNYAEADEYFQQALSSYTSTENKIGQGNALHGLGEVHQARSNHAEAEDYFNQSLVIFTSAGNSLGRANAFHGLGEVHQARSNPAKAEEYFKQALALYTEVGSSLSRTYSLLALGKLLLHQARYSEAKSFLHDAAEASNRCDQEWAQIRSKELLAEVLEAEKLSTDAR